MPGSSPSAASARSGATHTAGSSATTAAVATAPATPAPTGAPTDYTGFHAFIDKKDGTYFGFNLDSMASPTGSVGFGIQGVGMVDIAAPTFNTSDPRAVTIMFEGQAKLEKDAKIDLDFGLNVPGSNVQTVSVRLNGQIDTVGVTAKADLLLNGVDYVLVGGRPDQSPDHALATLVSAIGRQDWYAVYDVAAPFWSKAMTRDAFASQMSTYWKSHYGSGTTTVKLTGNPILADSGLGYWTASVKLEISSGSVRDEMNVTMQYVGDKWLMLDIRPA
jgi:hypothetical protein